MMKFRMNQNDKATFTTSAVILSQVKPEHLNCDDMEELGIVLNASDNPIIDTIGEHDNLVLYINPVKADVTLMHFFTDADGEETARIINIETMTQAEVDDFLQFEADYSAYLERMQRTA